MNLRTTFGGLGAFALAATLLAVPALVGSPAHASVAGSAPAVACLPGIGAATRMRQGHDTRQVSDSVKAHVAAELRTPAIAARAADLPVLRIPVVMHVIHGTHRADRRVSRTQARRLFRTLRNGFLGRQNPAAGSAGIVFMLRTVTVTQNDRWFRAAPMSAADRQMRRRLHRGNARTLNVYLNQPSYQGQPLLGYARFPWLARRTPKLDGVTVNVISMVGGRARGYNLGDTIVHETGHWLGLLHTFEGTEQDFDDPTDPKRVTGCSGPGDYVDDTPQEASASYRCNLTQDTCPSPAGAPPCPTPTPTPSPSPSPGTEPPPPPCPVPDPVQNFMDYSYDACMNHFTQGQRARMVAAFLRYRAGR